MRAAKGAGAEPYVPAGATLAQLAAATQSCRGCDLYRHATQAVLGEGPAAARIVMVGEQPGDREDRSGRPFVGPAGALLDHALADAGIARSDVYLTMWAELSHVRPQLIVCLGATAARAAIGKRHRLLEQRGQFFPHAMAGAVTATVHPSAILRAPDPEARRRDYEAFVADLRQVRERLNAAARAH